MARTAAFHESPIGLFARIHAAFDFVADVLADTFKLRAEMAKKYGLGDE